MALDESRTDWPSPALAQVYCAGRFSQEDRGFARVYRTDHLILHLFASAGRMRMGERTFDLQPGDLTVTPRDAEERFDFPGAHQHWCIRLVPGAAHPGDARLPLAPHYRLGHRAIEARHRFGTIAHDLRSAGGEARHPAALAAAAGAQALLCWLAARDHVREPASHAEACVERAAELLRSLTSASLPIAEVARRAGMSQNRLAKVFLERHGTTMAQFRTSVLIENAKWLMESSDLSLAEISRRIEIEDPHQFNKLFRRTTGLSPSAWMELHAPVLRSAPRPPVPMKPRAAKRPPQRKKPSHG